MQKLKLFVHNFLIYGMGGAISGVIPLMMLPVVTRIMPSTEYFGISDLSNTIVQFGSAIAVFGMYDAMYRMFFEKDDVGFQKKVCSTALLCTSVTSVLVFLTMLLCRGAIARAFFGNGQYANVVYLAAITTLAGSTNAIVSAPTRMQNKREVFLVTNAASPLISYGIAIPLLLRGHYVTALPLAAALSAVVIEVAFVVLNRSWFRLRGIDGRLLKQMLVIAVPLVPNFLIYWVFNSCDKVMITNFLGIGAAGIYSAGSKLGQASQLIYVAFAGGWQYFAFATMRDGDQVRSNSLVFEYLGVISFAAVAFVCAGSRLFFQIVFPEKYLSGFIVAPYLFFAPLLQMLFQVAGNQFLVVKKTWPNLFILSAGAVLNIVLNLTLIPALGIEGAAIATLAGYIVSDVICVIVLCRMKLMVVSKRFGVASVAMAVFLLSWRLCFSRQMIPGTVAAASLFLLFLWMYRDECRKVWNSIRINQ